MEEPAERLIVALAALMRWFDEHRLQAAVIGGVGASLRDSGDVRETRSVTQSAATALIATVRSRATIYEDPFAYSSG